MRRTLRCLPSPAMVVACIALAVALGGTSYAAIKLPRNSVGTKQLQANSINALEAAGEVGWPEQAPGKRRLAAIGEERTR